MPHPYPGYTHLEDHDGFALWGKYEGPRANAEILDYRVRAQALGEEATEPLYFVVAASAYVIDATSATEVELRRRALEEAKRRIDAPEYEHRAVYPSVPLLATG